jgi:N utilization substance protein B
VKDEVKLHGKSLARLMAVQGLYSYEVSGADDIDDVISRILHVEAENDDGEEINISQSPDKKLLAVLIKGAVEKQKEIDKLVTKYLKGDWKIEHMDNLILSVIRPAVYELKEKDTPVAVVLDEYINIAHAFYEMQEVGFINALLDSIAGDIRKDG